MSTHLLFCDVYINSAASSFCCTIFLKRKVEQSTLNDKSRANNTKLADFYRKRVIAIIYQKVGTVMMLVNHGSVNTFFCTYWCIVSSLYFAQTQYYRCHIASALSNDNCFNDMCCFMKVLKLTDKRWRQLLVQHLSRLAAAQAKAKMIWVLCQNSTPVETCLHTLNWNTGLCS